MMLLSIRGNAGLPLLLGLIVALTCANSAYGTIECEELAADECAFAVSSSGTRCVLEKDVQSDAAPEYKCQTSIIMAERPTEWIETDDCINTCGLQRLSVGLSTDTLLERDFTRKLCFSECRTKCPNINDLYTKLAAEDGIYLPSLCESLKPMKGARRMGAQEKPVSKKQHEEDVQVINGAATMVVKRELLNNPLQQSEQLITPSIPYPVAASAPVPPPSPMSSPATSPVSAPTSTESYPDIAEEPYNPVAETPSYYGEGTEPPYPDYEPYNAPFPPSPSPSIEAPSPSPPPSTIYPPQLPPAPAPQPDYASEPSPSPSPTYFLYEQPGF